MGRRRRRTPSPRRAPLSAWDELYPSFDLHGETAESASRRAARWLREKQSEGVPTVRVITGRGAHSAGPPVLRGEIYDLLATLRGTTVARFSIETGGGAFRVELRRPRRPASAAGGAPFPGTPSPAPSSRNLDPDLRRRAEEALWELGIDPTPALIRAEVQRLLWEREEP